MPSDGKYNAFYHSQAWVKTAEFVRSRDNFVCCHCGQPASLVHHVIPLRECYGSKLALDTRNLKTLCQECHEKEHGRFAKSETQRKMRFDKNGNVITAESIEEREKRHPRG